jgi:hypothetical protein
MIRPMGEQIMEQTTFTEKERAMAKKCLECPVCRHARKKQRGILFAFVKWIEGRGCPYCKAYEKVYGRKAHEPIAQDDGQTSTEDHPEKQLRRKRRLMKIIVGIVFGYFLLCYIFLPMLWTHYEHHPVMEGAVKRTVTKDGIPGDPLNVGLIGTKEELIRAMTLAKWHPADPITFRSSVDIVKGVLLHEAYSDAPVSNLYVFGRKQDLAFEQLQGGSPRERHHVRFWESKELGQNDRPMWIGAATFDQSVGLSHRTGQVTHHIAANIDAERDKLFADLTAAKQIDELYQVTGIGPTLNGRNGGGDRFYTDGEMTIGAIAVKNQPVTTQPVMKENPTIIDLKNRVWRAVK